MDFSVTTIAFGIFLTFVEGVSEWGYEADNGPGTWGNTYELCNGTSQSPINIVSADAVTNYSLPRIDRRYFYNPPTRMTLSNNGHTLVITINEGAQTISNRSVLPFDAQLAQYHFHWGNTSRNGDQITVMDGSEHTLDGKIYFGELHAVHFNTKYDSVSEAASMSDGLAVFGWFITTTYPQTNRDISHLLNIATNYTDMKDESRVVMDSFSLETLLPPCFDVYYRYKGSLTTPPCHESVVWTVFQDPIEITKEEAEILSSMFYATNTSDTLLVDNFRPPQPLNDRTVMKSPGVIQREKRSGAGTTVARPTLLLLLSLCTLIYCL